MKVSPFDWLPLLIAEDNHLLPTRLCGLSEAEWGTMIDMAARHQLAAMLYWRLKGAKVIDALSDPIQEALRPHYRAAIQHSLFKQAELRQVLTALAEVEVRPVVLKGALLAHTVYPSPVCRPMGDIDLWVRDDEIQRAWKALEGRGYSQQSSERRPLAMQQENNGEIQFRGEGGGKGLVELHWGAFPGELLKTTTHTQPEKMRERLRPQPLLDQPIFALAPEDNLLQVATHMAVNHRMSTNVLRSLLDVTLIARQGIDWDLLARRARQWRLATTTGYVLEMAQTLFGAAWLQPGIDALALSPMRRSLLYYHVNPANVLAGADLRFTLPGYTFQLAQIDQFSSLWPLVFRSLWPDSSWLHKRYGRTGWQIHLRHLTAALRGRF